MNNVDSEDNEMIDILLQDVSRLSGLVKTSHAELETSIAKHRGLEVELSEAITKTLEDIRS